MDAVLVLEDDPAVQEVLRAILEHRGFTVAVAATAERALALCENHRGRIALLIADVHLSSGSGVEAASEIRQYYPDIRILLISGSPVEFWDSSDRRNIQQLPQDSFSFLQKPFTCWSLGEKINQLLPRFQLLRTA